MIRTRSKGKGLGASGESRRQEIKAAGGSEVLEDFLEVWTPKLRFKGCSEAIQVKGGSRLPGRQENGSRGTDT